jgi:hypothetical protein
MKHLQLWKSLEGYKYGSDQYGIIARIGHEPFPGDLARFFKGTSTRVWGNILKGLPASGTYGEIIARIRRFGFSDAVRPKDMPQRSRRIVKNKSRRHLKKVEPLF